MTRFVLLITILIFALAACADGATKTQGSNSKEASVVSDDSLRTLYGADDYGMRSYVMTFLYSGDTVITDSAARSELMRGHLDNIQRLSEVGALVLAGPFMDGTSLRGIFIFDVTTVEEVQQLTATDPAVQAGVFRVEHHPWYGSAAVMSNPTLHERLALENP